MAPFPASPLEDVRILKKEIAFFGKEEIEAIEIDLLLINLDLGGANDELAAPGHGVAGVHHEVQDHLLDLTGIHPDGIELRLANHVELSESISLRLLCWSSMACSLFALMSRCNW